VSPRAVLDAVVKRKMLLIRILLALRRKGVYRKVMHARDILKSGIEVMASLGIKTMIRGYEEHK
jgi:hypothetical protein